MRKGVYVILVLISLLINILIISLANPIEKMIVWLVFAIGTELLIFAIIIIFEIMNKNKKSWRFAGFFVRFSKN